MESRYLDRFEGTERFTIRRRLGAGGMGVVYEVFDRDRDQNVALKTIHHLDALTLYRFKKEFRSLADLSHPNLVQLYELFSEGGQWFFTMELIEGENFLEFVCPERTLPEDDPLDRSDSIDDRGPVGAEAPTTSHPDPGASDPGGPSTGKITERLTSEGGAEELDPTEAATEVTRQPSTSPSTLFDRSAGRPDPDEPTISAPPFPPEVEGGPIAPSRPHRGVRPHLVRLRAALRQVAEALVELHAQGRLHRDIKPSNVLVTRRGRVVLLDFGLSTELEAQGDTLSSQAHIVGTAAFMAPEQALGRPLTTACDWYAVGSMLYQSLTGRLPFAGGSLDILIAKQTSDPPRPSSTVPGLPDDLDTLCVDLMRRRPEDRPSGEEVLRRMGVAPSGVPSLGTRHRPFVGREGQLATLGEAFASACRGETVAAFVHGGSGIGKTSLMQRFLDGLTERGEAVVLAGRCYERESVAYKALDDLIDALVRYLRRLSRREAAALLPRDLTALARIFPVLRRFEGEVESTRPAQAPLNQQEQRRRAIATLRELLARIGRRRPLVLAIDDLQWGDADSASLLADLLRPPRPPSLLLVGTYRTENAASSPCLRRLLDPLEDDDVLRDRRELAIVPLSPAEGLELALTLIGQDDEAARALAATIVRETGGNPYFVYELIQYLREGGELGESLAASSSAIRLDEVLWRRVRRLPDGVQELLEVVAVAGRPIRQSLACRAAGLGADGFSGLALLRSNHLIRGTGPGALDDVEAYHDRIRETVIGRIPEDRRRELHRRLAETLEAAGDADPETLAIHFEGAGDDEAAGHHYGRAADEASQSLAFDRAAKLYRRALELRPAGDAEGRRLRTGLADALACAGRGVDAAYAYQRAAVGAGQAELLELQRRAAYQFLTSGHIDEGLGAFRTILDRVGLGLPETPRRALIRLLVSRARLRLRGLRFRERDAEQVAPEQLELIDISRSVAIGISIVDVIRGSDYQTRSLLLALRAGEPVRIALALGWEAVHLACQGRPTSRRTARLIAAARSLAERLGHPQALGMARLSAGAAEFLEGRYRTGLGLVDQAEQILREQCTGVVWELDTARIFGLWSLFYLGRIAELAERSRAVFHEARGRGDRYMEATPGPFVGAFVRLALDDAEGARVEGHEALGRWSQQGFHIQHLNHYYGSLYVDLYSGDPDRAWQRIRGTARVLSSSLLLRIQQVRADVTQHEGRCAVAMAAATSVPEPYLRRAEGAARRLDRERLPWTSALSTFIRAGAVSVRGDTDRAARLLVDAAEGFDRVDMALFAAVSRRQLGRLRGGVEGRDLIERADTWMGDQAIRNPVRMAACLAPGFEKLA